MSSTGETPYKKLGDALSSIRTRMQESVAEVSGAVEIDDNTLLDYENGKKRPTEDILDLLISHFSVKEAEAGKLWKLAGYDSSKNNDLPEELSLMQQPIMLLPFDARIIYSDSMNIVIDKHGVVLNFMQGSVSAGQQMPAARVGMSLEHAKSIAKVLNETIKKVSEKQITKNLPSPKNNPKDSKN